ncbi:multi antimicrobial extrusion protein [Artemisia annua]|uniref:Multi antimicrobial extrusion protein n=1 Tax=Artemisia annua TaxID=35608 RepID=A0A2U1P0B8_ARTAN|nr:multi antimicrobial extrusion protein [Artemisia annua]
MRVPAHRFLQLGALGAPAVVLSLAIQGVFRGFKDTETPVFCLGSYEYDTTKFSDEVIIVCALRSVATKVKEFRKSAKKFEGISNFLKHKGGKHDKLFKDEFNAHTLRKNNWKQIYFGNKQLEKPSNQVVVNREMIKEISLRSFRIACFAIIRGNAIDGDVFSWFTISDHVFWFNKHSHTYYSLHTKKLCVWVSGTWASCDERIYCILLTFIESAIY